MVNVHVIGHQNGLQTDAFANKILKFVGWNFSQTFESSNLRLAPKFANRSLFFRFGVTIIGRLFVSNSKKGRIENEKMPISDQIGKKLKEKRQKQQSNVHSVHVRIGGNNDSIVAQIFDAVLNIQGVLQQI